MSTVAVNSPSNHWKFYGFWALKIALALLFLLAASMKLLGTTEMVQLFNAIGIGQWFRYFTAAVELAIGFGLLYPPTVALSSLLGAATMAVGTLVNIHVGHDPIHSSVIVLIFLAIAWTKHEQLLPILGRQTH